LWTDRYIKVGDEWRRAIDRRPSRARRLVGQSKLLGFPFIMDEELPALCDRGVRRFGILVDECLWEEEPLLEKVQWAHAPSRPLNRYKGHWRLRRWRRGVVGGCRHRRAPSYPTCRPDRRRRSGGHGTTGRARRSVSGEGGDQLVDVCVQGTIEIAFRQWDLRLYSPLCIALGACVAIGRRR